MVNDQEPRYRLVDSNGNVVGSLFQNADGNVEIQDETGTGSVFGPDGIVTPAIDAESASVEKLDTNYGYQVHDGETIQETIDRAEADGVSLVKVPTGIYEEEITVGRGMRVTGTAPDQENAVRIRGNSDSDATITITDLRSTITHLSVENQGSEDAVNLNGNRGVVAFCEFATAGDNVRVGDDNNRIVGNQFNGADLIFEDGADNNVYVGNTNIGTVDDSGSGNTESNT